MKSILTLLLLSGALLSCRNAYRDFPDKSSDDYYTDVAENYLDQFNFSKSLEYILPVLASQPTNERVVKIAYQAYAGRAGLRSADLILELTDGSETFFTVFAQHFPESDADSIADMDAAVAILEAYEADPSERTAEMNLHAMFLYYSQLGVTLNANAFDSDNEVEAGFDACDDSLLSDEDLQRIVRSIPRAIESASGVDETTADLVDSLNSNPVLATFVTTQNSVCPGVIAADVAACAGMRALINEGDSGIGIGAGVVTPCP